jgi:hypothetical protein
LEDAVIQDYSNVDSSPHVVARSVTELLVNRFRAVSLDQVTRLFGKKPAARRAMRRLEQSGLILGQTVMMERICALDAPVIAWSPCEEVPNFGRASWQLRTRWRDVPQRTVVYSATAKARQFFDGKIGGRPLRPSEIRHDCHVAEVYFRILTTRPHLAELWMPEDALVKLQHELWGERVPDAIIAMTPPMAIDFGGSYRTPKLWSFHRAMATRSIPYEIW